MRGAQGFAGFAALVLAASIAGSSGARAQAVDYSRIGIDSVASGYRGIVECRADLELAFPVAGIVSQAPVPEGAVVTAGQALLVLQQQVETIELLRREEVARDVADLQATEAQLTLAETQ
jgi:multidrug efflux pump subunit AcrA (membrane-fusion protein)